MGMASLLDAHGGGYHPVVAQENDKSWFGLTWLFAIIVVLFFAVIFMRHNRDQQHHHGADALAGVAPALALGAAARAGSYGEGHHENNYQHWDMVRDVGESRKETAMLMLGQSREFDKYAYEQRAATEQARYDMLLGFKDAEIRGMQNTKEILERIGHLESEHLKRENAEKDRKLSVFETITYLQPKAPYLQYPPYPPQYHCGYGDPAYPRG